MPSFSARRSARAAAVVTAAALAFLLSACLPEYGFHTVPAGIDATGASDVTAELNDFIAGVPDGATIIFPHDATFRVEGVVAVDGREDLVIDFNGARLISNTDGSDVEPYSKLSRYWPRHRAHFYVRDSARIEVRDLTVRGPHAAGGVSDEAWQVEFEAQHAIEVSRSSDVTVAGCDMSYIYGDGVYVGGGSERVHVTDCDISNTGRQGIAVTSARDVVVDGNRLDEIRRTAFDIEPPGSSPAVENIRIANNHVGNARLNFVSGHGGGSTYTGIEILDNVVDGEMQIHMKAPADTRRGSVVIAGNRSSHEFGSPAALFTVKRFDDVTVADNTAHFDGRAGGRGVNVVDACTIDIRGNTFTSVARHQQTSLVSPCPDRDTRVASGTFTAPAAPVVPEWPSGG